jgi:hypothetical protein
MSKRGLTMTISAMITFLCSYDEHAGDEARKVYYI